MAEEKKKKQDTRGGGGGGGDDDDDAMAAICQRMGLLKFDEFNLQVLGMAATGNDCLKVVGVAKRFLRYAENYQAVQIGGSPRVGELDKTMRNAFGFGGILKGDKTSRDWVVKGILTMILNGVKAKNGALKDMRIEYEENLADVSVHVGKHVMRIECKGAVKKPNVTAYQIQEVRQSFRKKKSTAQDDDAMLFVGWNSNGEPRGSVEVAARHTLVVVLWSHEDYSPLVSKDTNKMYINLRKVSDQHRTEMAKGDGRDGKGKGAATIHCVWKLEDANQEGLLENMHEHSLFLRDDSFQRAVDATEAYILEFFDTAKKAAAKAALAAAAAAAVTH